jgi:flavin-dependent dehydrogenase
VAARELARGGWEVLLVDRATFPRDKACGDVVGPQALSELVRLGMTPAEPVRRIGDLTLSFAGKGLRLPAVPGVAHPGHGLVLPRRRLDAELRAHALDAGALPRTGRVRGVRQGSEGVIVFVDDEPIRADALVGADGALSVVARTSGLLDEARALWGFAVRAYVPQAGLSGDRVDLFDDTSGLPSYGWAFLGPEGIANVGVGVGVGNDRRLVRQLRLVLERYVDGLGIGGAAVHGAVGGWLRMGTAGSVAARGRVLLVGDAAGLVNPLQGEGIWAAVGSGACAAHALLEEGPLAAAPRYAAAIGAAYAPGLREAAVLHEAWLAWPTQIEVLVRLGLAAAQRSGNLASGVGAWINGLVDLQGPGPAAVVGRRLSFAARVGAVMRAALG